MAGAVFLVVLQSILTTLNIPPFGRQIIYGVVLLALVLFYGRRWRQLEARRDPQSRDRMQQGGDRDERGKAIGKLRIGLIGARVHRQVHVQAEMVTVRHAIISGVYGLSARGARRWRGSRRARTRSLPSLRLARGDAHLGRGRRGVILAPNDARLDVMSEIHRLVTSGKAPLVGVACEKPLARTLAEAREMLRLAESAGLLHGYLENQIFSTAVQRGKDIVWRRAAPISGRPYIARAAEEHSGPHMPWFWQGRKQGGGVLSDMGCHSVEVARYLLTKPGAPRSDLTLVSANATTGNLKWTRPEYVKKLQAMMGPDVDYGRRPAEDFSRAALVMQRSAR